MARISKDASEIQEFILRHLTEHPRDIVRRTMRQFGRSRPTILRHIQELEENKWLAIHGISSGRLYTLSQVASTSFRMAVTHLWSESDLWRQRLLPLFKNVPQNVVDICQYAFTEMVNNVLDHARSPHVTIIYGQTYAHISMAIVDRGIGVFRKIQHDFRLDDPRTALLELSKGKLTSDRKNHSGEGIYFTSRMMDLFQIRSGNLLYSRARKDGEDWLVETDDKAADFHGTIVFMKIRTDADWTMRDVFNASQGDNLRFRKTHVPIKLAQYPGELLVSRSQAKRLLTRFNNFSEVFLDFQGVDQIGQAFADEIFRVFHDDYPDIAITSINANDAVKKMIEFVTVEARSL